MKELKPFVGRSFVPEQVDLARREDVVRLLQELLDRPVESVVDLERWLLDRSEFEAALGQTGSFLYIAMTCDTSDSVKSQRYLKFVEEVEPAVKPLEHALDVKFLELEKRFSLDKDRYAIYRRSSAVAVKLFVERNIPLQTRLALLSQEYQTICGAMMVTFDGREQTLPEMSRYLQETDRSLRERAWKAVASRRMQESVRLEELFDRMLILRNELALNAGFANFRDYQFEAYQRFDYGPQDCRAYHQSVEEVVVPFLREINALRRAQMGVSTLRPWDTAVDPLARPALRPFKDVAQLQSGVGQVVRRIDSGLAELYDEMAALQLLDLSSRKGKAPGGYQNTLDESRKPFIFMNAVGLDDDVRTLLHESGHAFHAYLCAHEPLVDYRHAPMEFCEVASMSMELMANDHLDVFYTPADARRSVVEFLEGVVTTLAWVAVIDAFQHWLYENPGHSACERSQAWLRCHRQLSGDVLDWSGLENERTSLWHRQLHIFEVPFYYIEYGIAQLGALQLWRQFRKDPQAAVANYKKALALGGSRPLPELFQAMGIRFDLSREMMVPLLADVRALWKELSA
jgi:oligoendopeptidase F